MSKFDKAANNILKNLDENFINSASDAIQHTWAKTIAHPSLGEEDEEFEVINHSLTSDGIIEEYYVKINGKLVTVPADEATILVSEQHGHKPKKKKEDEEDDTEEEDE